MKCQHCEKEVLAQDATFCPFCGKKLKNKRLEKGMKLIDFLKFLTDEELVGTMKTLSTISASEIRERLESNTHPVFVYTPVYNYSSSWSNGTRWSKSRERVAVSNLVTEYLATHGEKHEEWSDNPCIFKDQSITIPRRKLTVQDDPEAKNDYWFATYEECEQAVKKVLDENNFSLDITKG